MGGGGVWEMITRLQGGGGCQKWPQKGLRNICIAPKGCEVGDNGKVVHHEREQEDQDCD